MASHSVARAKTATLTGTTHDQITLTGGFDKIEVKNFSTTENLTVVYANGSAPSTPTAEVDDAIVLGPGEWTDLDMTPGSGNGILKVVGNGNKYQVRGVA